jgi:hypothetical protein
MRTRSAKYRPGREACDRAVPSMSRVRELIEAVVTDLDSNPLETHASKLAEIRRIAPHTILPLTSVEPLERYNCVMHALGLIGRMPDYPHPLLLARLAFVDHLVAKEVLQPCTPSTDALVTWSSPSGLQHIGKMVSTCRAESKWGLGILCAHGLDELPLRYGSVSRFFYPIEPSLASEHLHRYIFGESSG